MDGRPIPEVREDLLSIAVFFHLCGKNGKFSTDLIVKLDVYGTTAMDQSSLVMIS